MPRVVPYLSYGDVDAARSFLISAFGFRERKPVNAPEGYHNHKHVELELDDGSWIKLGPLPHQDGQQASASRVMIQVEVDDIDPHFARANSAGATIVKEPQISSHGDHFYDAADPQGQLWKFVKFADE
jgi:uncharacterized glyoxalase superfamily protein PhnB